MKLKVCVSFLITTLLCLTTTSSANEFLLSRKYNAEGSTSPDAFDELISKYKPLDFGYGTPNFNPSASLRIALGRAALSSDPKMHQYDEDGGHPRLLKAIANFFSPLLNRTLDPNANILATVGGTAGLFSIFQAFSEESDEWIVFEPCYSSFIPIIKASGAIPKFVRLQPSGTIDGKLTSADFTFDRDELRRAFNKKTKGILVNTPNNPIGKMFTYEELSFIAQLAEEHDVMVVFDEVYQFLNYDGNEHIRLPTFPRMFNRTLSICSASKMFTATGYRVGWVYGPENLIQKVKYVHQTMVLSMPPFTQEAVAVQLEEELSNYGKETSYLSTLRRNMESKRNHIQKILSDAGMTPITPQGGYYTVGNWTTMIDRRELDGETDFELLDYRFVSWFVKNLRVFVLPLSSSYSRDDAKMGAYGLRFTMIKTDETLQEFEEAMQKWKSSRSEESCK